MSRIITLIVVHCSASRCNQRYTVEMLRKDHNARFHNQGVGYHYYIERDGQLYPTRREDQVGIHARGYNANSIKRLEMTSVHFQSLFYVVYIIRLYLTGSLSLLSEYQFHCLGVEPCLYFWKWSVFRCC